jgi:hypothetical protein
VNAHTPHLVTHGPKRERTSQKGLTQHQRIDLTIEKGSHQDALQISQDSSPDKFLEESKKQLTENGLSSFFLLKATSYQRLNYRKVEVGSTFFNSS